MAAFESHRAELASADIPVVAASTDSPEHAATLAETCFGLGKYGEACRLALESTARLVGAFYEERRQILHATGFLLDPDGRIATSVYSSGAIGRLWPEETLSLVKTFRSRRATS